MLKWYEEKGECSDVIISSRVRLARNLIKYPFPSMLSDIGADQLVLEVNNAMKGYADQDGEFLPSALQELGQLGKCALVERHILSPLLAKKEQKTGLLVSQNESVSIMINEEDHIRIQALAGGMNMNKAFLRANGVDDAVYSKLKFAFDEKYGYLTACPTNVGTGLRASYMVFLPALGASGKINRLASEVSKYGIALRGIYGEGTEGTANIYQLSNQKTLGSSEEEIIESLNNIVGQVIRQERRCREHILRNNYDFIENQIYRAYGILKYARQINTKGAMDLLAQVKLGLDTGILKASEDKNIYKLMMDIQPANLQVNMGKNISGTQRDKMRADYINKNLPHIVK